jgi:hypothetical protein
MIQGWCSGRSRRRPARDTGHAYGVSHVPPREEALEYTWKRPSQHGEWAAARRPTVPSRDVPTWQTIPCAVDTSGDSRQPRGARPAHDWSRRKLTDAVLGSVSHLGAPRCPPRTRTPATPQNSRWPIWTHMAIRASWPADSTRMPPRSCERVCAYSRKKTSGRPRCAGRSQRAWPRRGPGSSLTAKRSPTGCASASTLTANRRSDLQIHASR